MGGDGVVLVRPFVNFAVALFLFLSGYLTKIDERNFKYFCKKRIVRVLIPYIIWTILYAISKGDFSRIPEYLLTAKANGTLYYIFVYVQFVLLTPWLGKLACSRYRWSGWIISPVSIFLFKYIPVIFKFQLNNWLSIIWSNLCLGWLSFYYLGLCLGNSIIERKFSTKRVFLYYLGSLVIQILEGFIWRGLGMSNVGSQLKLSNILTGSLFLLLAYIYLKSDSIIIESKLLAFIGDCSFGIYLCHIMVIKVLNHTPGYNFLPFGFSSAIVLLLSLVCVCISKRLFGAKISRWLGFS